MTVETAPNSLKVLPWASALAQMAEIGHPTISWMVPVAGKWPNVRGWRMLRQTVGSLWGMWSTLSRSGCPGFSGVPLQQEMYLFFLCGTDILGKSKLWPLWSCKLVQNTHKKEWFFANKAGVNLYINAVVCNCISGIAQDTCTCIPETLFHVRKFLGKVRFNQLCFRHPGKFEELLAKLCLVWVC